MFVCVYMAVVVRVFEKICEEMGVKEYVCICVCV